MIKYDELGSCHAGIYEKGLFPLEQIRQDRFHLQRILGQNYGSL